MPSRASRRVGAVLIAAGLGGFGCDRGAAPDPPPIQVYASAPCPEYFPGARFSDRPDGTDLWNGWFASSLRAFGEPCLPPDSPGPDEAYRFLWIRSFDPHLVVRLERWGERVYVVSKVGEERMLLRPGLRGQSSVAVGPFPVHANEKKAFDGVLEDSGFWGLPTRGGLEGGSDGAEWVLEGWREGRYHVVSVWSPVHGGPHVRFADACMELVRLARVQVDDERVY